MMKYLLSTKKCLVLKYCLILIVLGLDTSSRCSMAGPQRGSGTSVKCRSLTVCWEGWGNSNLSKTKTIKYYALQVMHHFTPETENVDFYDLSKKMIWWQPLTVWTDWIVTRNGGNIRRVVWRLVLIVWSNWISKCWFY